MTSQHGDADHSVVYTSPHLPKPLNISLADSKGDDDRRLFSHYLWNSSLLLAELIEAGTLGSVRPASSVAPSSPNEKSHARNGSGLELRNPSLDDASSFSVSKALCPPLSTFSVKALTTIELGAGTALPSLMSSLLGASCVQVTDYPSPATMSTLRDVISRNVMPVNSPFGKVCPVNARSHEWGVFEDDQWAVENKGKYGVCL